MLDRILALHSPRAAADPRSAAICLRVLELQALRLGLTR
jgi:hypothetical protein